MPGVMVLTYKLPHFGFAVTERHAAVLGLYIKKVLVQLNLTLVNKSDTYTDPFLKAVFRLNNNQVLALFCVLSQFVKPCFCNQ